ncbi:MAG: hypothetical protein VYA34_02990 [Myxococcota bacterium]|nr:hypothetical protein [Myxococcota bacterium]
MSEALNHQSPSNGWKVLQKGSCRHVIIGKMANKDDNCGGCVTHDAAEEGRGNSKVRDDENGIGDRLLAHRGNRRDVCFPFCIFILCN